jgi:hypothetical protein
LCSGTFKIFLLQRIERRNRENEKREKEQYAQRCIRYFATSSFSFFADFRAICDSGGWLPAGESPFLPLPVDAVRMQTNKPFFI